MEKDSDVIEYKNLQGEKSRIQRSVSNFNSNKNLQNNTHKFTEIKQMKITGNKNLSGDYEVDSIKTTGGVILDGNLHARIMKSAGKFIASGDISIDEKLKFFGQLDVNGNVICRGKIRGTGNINTKGDIHSDGSINLFGKTRIDGGVYSNSNITFNSYVRINQNVISKKKVKIFSKVNIGGTVLCEKAEIITLFGNIPLPMIQNIDHSIIKGSLIASDSIKLQNIEVQGDLAAVNIHLGKNTIVHGNIYYVNKIHHDNQTEIKGDIKTIDEAQLEDFINEFYDRLMNNREIPTAGMPKRENNRDEDDILNKGKEFENTDEPGNEGDHVVLCKNCGFKLDKNAKFCSNCGSTL